MIKSIGVVPALATALTPLFMPAAFAHDGWAWTGDGFLQVEGTITGLYIGNPRATLDVDVAGVGWRVELGSLLATTRSGLTWGVVRVADDVVAIGRRGAAHRIQAVRVVVNGVPYDIAPDGAGGGPGSAGLPITAL